MKLFMALFLLVGSVQAQLEILQWQTPEGASVLFTQTKGLPMLDVQLSFDAASSRDAEQHGLARLTNTLIGTATKYLSEEQIINQFESLGSQFSTASLKDMAIISMRSLTRDTILKQSLSLFSEVMSQVDFQQKYLTREKKQTHQLIELAKQNPGQIASLEFAQLVFANHAYAHAKTGTKESLEAIQLKDLNSFYRQYYVAKNLTIALVGDISKTQAKQIARQISHGLSGGKKAKNNKLVVPLKQATNKHIEFPSQQTHLLIGQAGVNRNHADYYSLYLGNHILGGSGLTSILSDEIREKKGLAYSVSSYFTKMKSNGYFLIKLQTKNIQAQEAKKLALDTLKKFVKYPLDAQLLQAGKDNIIGGFALQTASNANILTYLSIMGFYQLPLDYLSGFIDKIKKISAEEIQRAFANLIDTDKLIVLSVGADS